MRILDVSPRAVWPPDNGSTYRMYHLLRELSERHEVRQFSQPLSSQVRQPAFTVDVRPSENYLEHRNQSRIAAVASELCNRSWIRPQAIFSGACLELTRPALLRDWLRWADVALVEYPWQFAYCRRVAPALPMVLASHNIEIATRTSNARAAGVPVDRSVMLWCVRRFEEHAVERADLILAVSEEDRQEYLTRFGVEDDRVVTVPNGTDIEGLLPLGPEARRAMRAQLGLPDRPTVLYMAAGPKIPDIGGTELGSPRRSPPTGSQLCGRRRDFPSSVR